MANFVTREYNSLEVNKIDGTVTKTSNTGRMKNEILYYRTMFWDTIGESLRFPRYIDSYISEFNGGEHSLTLEYIGYDNLGVLLTKQLHRGNTDKDRADLLSYTKMLANVFSSLQEVLKSFHYKDKAGNFDNIKSMYIDKTEREYNKLVGSFGTNNKMFISDYIILNGIKLRNFVEIWEDVKSYILEHMLGYDNSIIHGDLCFSNILYTKHESTNLFKFIDPRGSFGNTGIWGDSRYDIAKLYHSVDGVYEFIINDLFKLTQHSTGNEFFLRLLTSDMLGVEQSTIHIVKNLFENVFFKDYSKKEIKLIQGLIFVGMCARHYDNELRQIAMYISGIRLLNEAMEL